MLPFTREAFFNVFAAYNERLWPLVAILWVLTAFVFVAFVRATRIPRWLIPGLLIVHWVWSGVAYHAAYFSAINPAAWAFSGLFLLEAGLLVWYGLVRGQLHFTSGRSLRHVLSFALVFYSLTYPLVARAEGHTYPPMPTFGLPCPTTILTIGFLMSAGRSLPPAVALVPLFWAFVGGSAAFLLGVRADLVLLVAGILLAMNLMVSRRELRRGRGAQSQVTAA